MTGIPISILTPQGVIAAPYTAESLADAATREPQGVYTLARTFKSNQALLLDDHLDRLEQSAQLEGISTRLDRSALRAVLRALIDQSGYAEARFRITVPRDQPDHLILSLELFKPVPTEIIENGARVITLRLERHNPIAKSTAWMAARQSAVGRFPPGIYEAILVGLDGALLEGTSSNFYAIKDDALRTAGEDRVLQGIARRILLEVAPAVLPVQLDPVNVNEIDILQEALLTSSGRGVVPIVEIGGRAIGTGNPGPYTRRLRAAYDAWADAHLEPI